MCAEITRQRDAHQSVRDDETVGGERAHPAVDVEAAGAARGEDGHGKHGGCAGDHDRARGSFVARVRRAERFVGEAVVRHQQQDTRGGGDARERSGEQADERADIDEDSEEGDAAYFGEYVHRSGARAEILSCRAQAQDFGVGADGEDGSSEEGTLNYRAGNGLQGIARFGAERGGAFKSDKTEEREDQAKA